MLFLDVSLVFSGAENSLLSLIQHLDRNMFRPILCFVCPRPHQDRFREANVEVRYLTTDGDGWLESSFWKFLPRGSDCLRRIIMGRLLSSLARREHVDIVHVNLLWPKPFWFLWWPQMVGIATVGHARSYMPDRPFPPRMVQKACTSVIHVSRCVATAANRRFVHPRSYQIYNPIETDRYSDIDQTKARRMLGIDRKLRVISSVGLLSPHKGHDIAIRAFAKVSRIVPDAVLYVAGGGNSSELRRLQEIAAQCCVSEKVMFSGEQLKNVEDVYSVSEVVLSLTKCGEAFGRVPLEAGAAGRPVIVTCLGAAPELIVDGKTGYLINPNDTPSISELIIRLLQNPKLCANMGSFARDHVEAKFNPRKHAAAVERVYREILTRHRMS